MSTLAVLDTHVVLWMIGGERRRLGRRARSFVERIERGRAAAYVPTIALAEIAEAERRGVVTLRGGFASWAGKLARSGRYHVVDLTLAVVVRAHELYDIPERADRLIAATAVELDVPLVTRDSQIAAAPGVDALW